MKSLIILIFIFVFQIQTSLSQKSKLINNINQFSFNIYDKIDKGNANVIFSGYSISNALSIIYAGAKEKTAEEFETILQNNSKQNIHKYYKALSEDLSLYREFEILTANALWLQNSYKYDKNYEEIISSNYNAEINTANFKNKKNREKAKEEINLWVKEKTKDNITDFIKSNMLSESSVLIIINAIYFNSVWDKAFLVEKTKKNKFYTLNGDSIETNFLNNKLLINYFEDEKVKVIEIPYKNKKASIVLMLPNNNYQNFINEVNLNYYKQVIQELRKKNVNVSLPKFKFEADYNLSEILKKIGLKLAFKSKADFSGITGNKDIHISKIIHKSVIELNEKGTEASSSTAILTTRSTSIPTIPKEFIADHPFVFFIKDNTSNLILFIGVMNKP